MAQCHDCNRTEEQIHENDEIEWVAIHDCYLCGKCEHKRGQGGSRSSRRGGLGTGGMGGRGR